MPVYYMNMDSCRMIVSKLNTTHEQIEATASALLNSINSMVGITWIAPSANQYLADQQQWFTRVEGLLQMIKDMSANLDAEIQEWEQVGNSF